MYEWNSVNYEKKEQLLPFVAQVSMAMCICTHKISRMSVLYMFQVWWEGEKWWYYEFQFRNSSICLHTHWKVWNSNITVMSLTQCFFVLFCFEIYWLEDRFCRERREREERERGIPSTGPPSKVTATAELNWSQGLLLGLAPGQRGPEQFNSPLMSSQGVNRKKDWECSSQDSTWCPIGRPALQIED